MTDVLTNNIAFNAAFAAKKRLSWLPKKTFAIPNKLDFFLTFLNEATQHELMQKMWPNHRCLLSRVPSNPNLTLIRPSIDLTFPKTLVVSDVLHLLCSQVTRGSAAIIYFTDTEK